MYAWKQLIGDVTEASGWILQCTGSLCSDLAKCSKTDWMTPQCTWTMSQTYCMSNPRAFLRQRNGTLIEYWGKSEGKHTQKAAEGSWSKWNNGLAEYHDGGNSWWCPWVRDFGQSLTAQDFSEVLKIIRTFKITAVCPNTFEPLKDVKKIQQVMQYFCLNPLN